MKVRYRHVPSALVRYRSKKWGCFRLLRSIKRDVRKGPAGAAVRGWGRAGRRGVQGLGKIMSQKRRKQANISGPLRTLYQQEMEAIWSEA